VVDTPRSHSALHDFEAASFSEDNVLGWHTHVLEDQVCVSVGRVVVAVDREHALNFNAGGIGWHNDDRLLLVPVRMVGIGLAQHNVDLASWVSGAGNPPFLYP
jgi:hypothetical protein